MGYMRHHAIVVTSWDDEAPIRAHERAMELGLKCSNIVASGTNGYVSFMVCPDGSKEGWTESDDGDGRRKELKNWMLSTRYDDGSGPLDWVEVQYGDDDHQTLVVSHSDGETALEIDAGRARAWK